MVIERETDHFGVGTSVARVGGSWHSGHECSMKEMHWRRVRVRSCDKAQLCPKGDRNFSPMAPCISGAVQPHLQDPSARLGLATDSRAAEWEGWKGGPVLAVALSCLGYLSPLWLCLSCLSLLNLSLLICNIGIMTSASGGCSKLGHSVKRNSCLFAPKATIIKFTGPNSLSSYVSCLVWFMHMRYFKKRHRVHPQLYLVSQLGIEIPWVTLFQMSYMD